MKKLLLSIAMIAGCAHGQNDGHLKTVYENMVTSNEELRTDKQDLCAILIEMDTMGAWFYVGDFTFYNPYTDQSEHYSDLVKDCDLTLENFREAVAKRANPSSEEPQEPSQ